MEIRSELSAKEYLRALQKRIDNRFTFGESLTDRSMECAATLYALMRDPNEPLY